MTQTSFFSFFLAANTGGGGEAVGCVQSDPTGSGGGRWLSLRTYDTRRSPLPLAVRSTRHILVCGGPNNGIQTMMQLYASVARLRSSGAHSSCRHESHGASASNRYLGSFLTDWSLKAPLRQNLMFSFLLLLVDSAVAYATGLNSKPSGTRPVFT
jgi:hypothetical protein